MRHITLSLAVAVAGAATAFTNPIIPGMYPDPSICRVDSDYYLVNSSFQLFPGVPIWHSRDLVNWTQIGNVLDRPSQLPLRDGWYYLLIAEGGTEMGHSATIARSRDIHGPYESNPDNPILYHQRRIAQANPIQGTGHADLVEGPDGRWWMVCLAFRPQTNGMHLTGRD